MWYFAQRTGQMAHNDQVMPWVGYAGNGAGRNNPAMQNVPDVGPLPCGRYTIMAPYNSPTTGPYSLALVPDVTNTMFGRSAFRLHGNNATNNASEGCMVEDVAARTAIWTSGDHQLTVVVDLPAPQVVVETPAPAPQPALTPAATPEPPDPHTPVPEPVAADLQRDPGGTG